MPDSILLTADETVSEILRIQRRLTPAESQLLGELMQRDPGRATRKFNERLCGKALTEDDVLQSLRDVLRDLQTQGDA